MKALLHTDWPDPEGGPEEVLVRVRACGICGAAAGTHLVGRDGAARAPLDRLHAGAEHLVKVILEPQ